MTTLKYCLKMKEKGKAMEDKREILFVCNQVDDLTTYDKILKDKTHGVKLEDIVWHDDLKVRLLEYKHSPYGYCIEIQDRNSKEWDPEGLGSTLGCSIISALLLERKQLLKQYNSLLEQNKSLQKTCRVLNDDYFKNLTPEDIVRLAKKSVNLSTDNSQLYNAIIEISKMLPKRYASYEEMARSVQSIKTICDKYNPLEAVK